VAAAGPLAGAAVLDATGDFTPVYLGTAAIVLAGLALMTVARRPQRVPRRATAAT